MIDKKITVMIIEDEELLLQAISKKINLSGMETVSCAHGKQAIDYLNSMEKLPSAIWLDYYLKDMNGLEFVGEIKKNDKLKDIPIVVVSNSADPEKVHNILGLGANEYLLKAKYSLDEIIEVIKKFINKEEVK